MQNNPSKKSIRKFISKGSEETKLLGIKYAKTLKGNETIALFGEAGAGKTVFVKGLCEGLGIKQLVTSPTFVILNLYEGNPTVFHYDMYRIKNSEECQETDFFENLGKGINVIEWAENIVDILPQNCRRLFFSYGKEVNEREIEVESFSI